MKFINKKPSEDVIQYALRFVDNNRIKAQIQFDPSGYWVGLIWRKTSSQKNFDDCIVKLSFFHIMISIIPMLPIHITLFLKPSQMN